MKYKSFFALPIEIKLKIYKKLPGDSLINLHLAFPDFTNELTPYHQLHSRFQCQARDIWPKVTLRFIPNLDQEDLILSTRNLNPGLQIDLRLNEDVTFYYGYHNISERLFTNLDEFRVHLVGSPEKFISFLQSANCKMKRLILKSSSIGDEEAKALAQALASENCKLLELNLSNNEIKVEGAKALAQALASENCKLQELNLNDNDIGDEGAKALAQAIKSENCRLKRLHLQLSYRNVVEGVRELAQALKSKNCKLLELILVYDYIDEEVKEALYKSGKCTMVHNGTCVCVSRNPKPYKQDAFKNKNNCILS